MSSALQLSTASEDARSAKMRILENTAALFFLQAATYIFPLITLPYLARTLGQHNFGVYSFAFAITQYFAIITDYGFNLTATREIANSRGDSDRIASIVTVVYAVKILLLIACFLATACALKVVPRFHDSAPVFFACFLSVVGNVLFPVWYFQGLECMKHITATQVIGRLVGTLLVFRYVSSSSDCALAAALQSGGSVVAGLLAIYLIYRNGHLRVVLPKVREIRSGLRDGFAVFTTSVMSISLQNGAVLALGLFAEMSVVGAYAAVERIVKGIISLFTPITQSFFPHASKKFSEAHHLGVRTVFRYGVYVVSASFGIAVLMAILSRKLVLLIFGNVYLPYHIVLPGLALWMILGVTNNFLGVQFLVASGKAATYSRCFTVAAIVTIILLLWLIPLFGYKGAMASVTIGEAVLTGAILSVLRRANGVACIRLHT